MSCPDNYDQWKKHDAEQNEWLQRRPICSECFEHMQDETCYEINGELICPDCLETYHQKSTEDFIF